MQLQDARILYVEDDSDTRELVTLILEHQNCQVIATANGDEALRLARSEHFDIYVIDNWMPGTSGVRLCEQLREFDQHTPVLFYSGAAYETDRERALASGAQGYLVKPADGDALMAEMSRLLSDTRQATSATVTEEKPGSRSRQLVSSLCPL
jgi:two-component system phosphate regulon response regulator PhoB